MTDEEFDRAAAKEVNLGHPLHAAIHRKNKALRSGACPKMLARLETRIVEEAAKTSAALSGWKPNGPDGETFGEMIQNGSKFLDHNNRIIGEEE